MVRWLFTSKEITNFTYDLEEHNKLYLAAMIADILGIKFSTVQSYINEIDEDEELRAHIIDAITNSDLSCMADTEVQFGRRIGWYAFARAIKP